MEQEEVKFKAKMMIRFLDEKIEELERQRRRNPFCVLRDFINQYIKE